MAKHGHLHALPDSLFLRLQYFLRFGRLLHLHPPRLYTEKLQWIKIHCKGIDHTRYIDKLAVRDYVSDTVGSGYLIPLLAQYDSVDQIEWASLPDRFVIKCTHGSGMNIICAGKAALEVPKAMEKLRAWMRIDWCGASREWYYRGIPPRLMVEQFMGSEDGTVPVDYKIMCFDGVPHYIFLESNRYHGQRRNIYDTQWVQQQVETLYPTTDTPIERPTQLEEMLDVAARLSKGFAHVRVDLYVVDGKVYFGELTFTHGAGLVQFDPISFDRHMGDLIHLPLGD